MEGLVQTTSRMLRLRRAARAAALLSISPTRLRFLHEPRRLPRRAHGQTASYNDQLTTVSARLARLTSMEHWWADNRLCGCNVMRWMRNRMGASLARNDHRHQLSSFDDRRGFNQSLSI